MIETVESLKIPILKLINTCFYHILMIDILNELDQRNFQFRDEIIMETKEMLPVKTQKYIFEHYKISLQN